MSQKPIAIWTAEGCSAPESYAARELKKYITLAWGAEYVTDEAAGAQLVRVATAERLGLENPPTEDGFVIRRDGGDIVIAGGSPRGTIYGVYAFIERFMGVRFFTPDTEYIPTKAPLPLPEKIDMDEHPAFAFRENQWFEACHSGTHEQNADFAAKMANLGGMCELDDEHGSNIWYPGSHTFQFLCAPDEYFEEHPEYFALVGGKRVAHIHQSQLCLTNPDVLKVVVENLKKTIEEVRANENPKQTIFAVAQNDGYGYCECENCAAIDAEEGSHAGALIRFVNAVAEAIEPEYPDVIIDTLAYNYSRPAPTKTKPRHNVVVRMCTIEACLSHPLRECQQENDAYVRLHQTRNDGLGLLNDEMADWGKICTHYNCWTYVTNFSHYLAPVPNLWVQADNFKFFKELGITDLRLQGNRQSKSGEMGSLRSYVAGKLLWNPDRDNDKLMLEFAAGYYGMAAGPILAYLRMVNEKGAQCHAGLYDQPWEAPYLDADYQAKAEEYFRQARALADNDEVLRRVEKAYLSVEYVGIMNRLHSLTREEGTALLNTFARKLRDHDIICIREVGGEINEKTLDLNIKSLLDQVYGKE